MAQNGNLFTFLPWAFMVSKAESESFLYSCIYLIIRWLHILTEHVETKKNRLRVFQTKKWRWYDNEINELE
jgi:hypothetical protein